MSDDTPPTTTTVTWKPTGPYVIEGPVVVRDNEGTQLIPPPTKVPGQVKLCGCGLSRRSRLRRKPQEINCVSRSLYPPGRILRGLELPRRRSERGREAPL